METYGNPVGKFYEIESRVMLVYRYNHIDGGGPWVTKDGLCRHGNVSVDPDGYHSACTSIESLLDYFNKCPDDLDELLKYCYIASYDIPEKDIYILPWPSYEVRIPSKYIL